jgi:trehalose 6-phosphate phosphatase
VGEKVLAPFLERPDAAGIFLDFDGTLSEIAPVPSAARPVEGVDGLLDRLGRRFRLVAIVSGRSAAELLEWLGPGIEIWGIHGAQRVRDGRVELADRARPYADLMARVRAEAERRLESLALPGVVLEDKGVMLGLHFRSAADPDRARRSLDELADELASTYGLTRAGGRLAFELRPPVAFSKSDVVLERSRAVGLAGAMFVGDDRVDISAFDALDELAAEGVSVVRVAVRSSEAPDELLERADLVVDGPSGVVALLRRLS